MSAEAAESSTCTCGDPIAGPICRHVFPPAEGDEGGLPMSADVLRQAAALMRERARAAMGDRPEWFTDTNGFGDTELWARRDEWDYLPQPVLDEHSQRKTPGSFAHFAALTPAVALAVADWLDAVADTFENEVGVPEDLDAWPPFRVARAYMGESA